MFLIDKYTNNLDNIININDIYNINYINNNYQHLIIYGQNNFYKNYFINSFLKQNYGQKNIKLTDVEYTISGYSNIKTKIIIKQSKYHIIIEPNLNGLDKYLIQEIIHEYAKSKLLNNINNNNLLKIVIINKIDNLSYHTQTLLRRTIEIYSSSCKFILLCDNLSKIIDSLRSRCLLIRIPMANKLKILDIVLCISNKENIKINVKQLYNIINNCDDNINNAIWLLDTIKYNVCYKNTWLDIINDIVFILENKIINSSKKLYINIKLIKEKFYLLFITNINTHLIIRNIMIKLLNNTNDLYKKYKIINITSIFEQRLNKGTRHIIHFEAYIIELMDLYISNNN